MSWFRRRGGKNLACLGGVAGEAFGGDGGCWVAVGDGAVGLFPVALAVPESAWSVFIPEGVIFGPDTVPEAAMGLAGVGGAGGDPTDVGEEADVVVGGELLPLPGGASAGYGCIVLCCLVGVVSA